MVLDGALGELSAKCMRAGVTQSGPPVVGDIYPGMSERRLPNTTLTSTK